MLPGDIFVDQHFFEAWLSLKPNWLIRFSYDLERMEMKLEAESENH
jgi:hypothetical protein